MNRISFLNRGYAFKGLLAMSCGGSNELESVALQTQSCHAITDFS